MKTNIQEKYTVSYYSICILRRNKCQRNAFSKQEDIIIKKKNNISIEIRR
jgi:hypothetical protein